MIFSVKNYTHYNTEDLEAFLAGVEELAEEMFGFIMRTPVAYYSRDPNPARVGAEVTFKDFTSKKTHVTENYYCQESRRSHAVTRRNFVKFLSPYGNRPAENDIRIVPPTRLGFTPLEQLSLCGSGEDPNCLSVEVKEQLARRLLDLYDSGGPRSLDSTQRARVDQHAQLSCPIRIMPKREGKVDTAEKHRVARHRAQRTWGESRYSMDKVLFYMERLDYTHKSALGQLSRSKVPLSGAEEEFSQALEAAGKAALDAAVQLRILISQHAPTKEVSGS
tara:strand:- start:249 stop:1079 length:831 start_codon:yes stop_codon:yes gene_type:complete